MSAKASFGSLCLATCLSASVAHAHISLEMAGEYMSRAGDDDDQLKDAPCGMAGAPRGSNVYTFEPGQTITIKLVEFVPHPGYFRISFDNDGDDGFMEPQSIMPENRDCMMDETRCGKTDFCNTPTVLLDNIEPHWEATILDDAINRSWQVKLPDVECENCTLQILQIMTDPPGHGPYDLMSDIYHQCIDVTLKRGSGMGANTGPAMNTVPMMVCPQAMVAAPTSTGGAGGMSGGTAGMSAAQGGASGAPAMASPGVPGMSSPAPTPPPVSTTTVGAGGAMAAPVAAPVMALPPPAAAPAESSGCSVVAGSPFNVASLGLLGVALFALARRRRTN
jgi:MYXO-CTERM domain-containing protein